MNTLHYMYMLLLLFVVLWLIIIVHVHITSTNRTFIPHITALLNMLLNRAPLYIYTYIVQMYRYTQCRYDMHTETSEEVGHIHILTQNRLVYMHTSKHVLAA